MAVKIIYRVMENVMSDGTSRFMPQFSFWSSSPINCGWFDILLTAEEAPPLTHEEAKAIISDRIQKDRERLKVVQVIEHPYTQD